MSQSIESRITDASSKEAFKKAKSILKNGHLACCYMDADSRLQAVFSDAKKNINRAIVQGYPDNFSSSCTCGVESDKICEHAVAAVLHYTKHERMKRKDTSSDISPKYAGLKYEALPELLAKAINEPRAEVVLESETEFPHVPSKWEKTLLAVTLKFGKRDYKGNLANLRQLHFGKSMAASLDISYFSQQDRQIIRFLAINGEPDGSKISLDAEETAEFFHCLPGFRNFSRLGEQVTVNEDNAEPVLLCKRDGNEYLLYSALLINGAPLQAEKWKVITGRSGCWAGVSGEYWWIPASIDISWLRGLLRAAPQRCDRESVQLLMSGKSHLPVRVLEISPRDLRVKKCKVLLSGGFTEEKTFELTVMFDYEGVLFKADGKRLACTDGSFWKRDNAEESRIINDLTGFGFAAKKAADSTSILFLEDVEAAGIFLQEVLPVWGHAGNTEIYLSSSLAEICGRQEMELKLFCSLDSETSSHFELKYQLAAGGVSLDWRDVIKTIELKRSGILLENGRFVKIGRELSRFMDSVSDLVHLYRDKPGIIRLPRFSAAYWAERAKDIPGAVPPELREIGSFAGSVLKQAEEDKGVLDTEKVSHEFKGDLRHYQLTAVSWMKELAKRGFNSLLADEMGLGKTVQTLAMLAASKAEDYPSLILCPTSLVENWNRETAKFVPSFKVSVIKGSKREKQWEDSTASDLVICSYALAKRDNDSIKKLRFNYLILDEAQHIKNPFTANAKTCKSVQADHRLVLTGTPLENSPEDLWSIFDFLHPGMLGTFNSFKKHFSDIHESPERQDDLAARVAPFMLRRKKSEVSLELPPKQEQVLFCNMEEEQRKLYDNLLLKGREQCDNLLAGRGKITHFDVLTTLLRLRQICCHPLLLPEEFPVAENVPSAKTDLMKELLLESIDSGHKVLLFSQFTSLLGLARKWLEEDSIRYEYLDGATKNRMDRVDNFNDNPDIPVFLLSLKAGGTGLNLTSADTVIIYDPWWNPAVEAQAADRTHRIGQTRTVNSMKLVVKDSIEEKILELQKKKKKIFESLVENPSAAAKKMSLDDLEFIFR